VSPDGIRYAHLSTNSIYVENVSDGTTVELGDGHSWYLIAVENGGVYAGIVQQAGLWFLPYQGVAVQITTAGFWSAEANGFAYGLAVSAVPQGVPTTIIRINIQTHAVSNWFTRDGASASVLGFDNHGNPLISLYYYSGGGNEVWLTTGPATATPLFGSTEGLSTYSPPLADSHGIWFVMNYFVPYGISAQGIALYVPGSGIYWMSTLGTQLAGGCA
jgi:hypothetical protein